MDSADVTDEENALAKELGFWRDGTAACAIAKYRERIEARTRALLGDQLADAARVANEAERALDRHVAATEAIANLVGADDIELGSPFGLIKLVTRVGVLARVTANDSQAWDVLRKHVTANHKLAKLVHSLNEKIRHLEADRQELAERVLDLEGDLETATTAYGDLRARLMPSPAAEDVDANGCPVVGLELEQLEPDHVVNLEPDHVVNLGPVEASHG